MMRAVELPRMDKAPPAIGGWPRRWGVHFVPSAGVGPLLEAAASLERAGVAELSVSDEAFSVEPLSTLAAIAARHPRLRVGVRVTNPYVRHPLTLAREARVVAELSAGAAGGGLVLGLGLGGAMSLRSTGLMARRRITGLTDALSAIRALLDGEHVRTQTGDFVLDGRLDGPPVAPGRIRFELTGRGPRMLAAASAFADAVLIVGLSRAEGVRVLTTIREAARAAGRAEPPAITWATYAVTDEALLGDIAPYMAYGLAEATTADRGVDASTIATIRDVLHREGREAAARLVPREYLEARVMVGSAVACRAGLARWAAEQQIDTVLLRIPESSRRERWLGAACSVAAPVSARTVSTADARSGEEA